MTSTGAFGGGSGSSTAIASHAVTDASTAIGAASMPGVPTSSAASSADVSSIRVIAAIPAADPTASAAVGDMSVTSVSSVARATPRKIAGNTGPPRKPQPRQTAYAAAFA